MSVCPGKEESKHGTAQVMPGSALSTSSLKRSCDLLSQRRKDLGWDEIRIRSVPHQRYEIEHAEQLLP